MYNSVIKNYAPETKLIHFLFILEDTKMKDLIFAVFSEIFQMDMTNPHDIPFAMPLMMACFVGGIIGFTLLRFIGNEQKEDRENAERQKEAEQNNL